MADPLTPKDIFEMERDELIKGYDSWAENSLPIPVQDVLKLLHEEIHYRRQQELSNQMWSMTLVITVLTITNVALVAYQVFS
jgi:hypothetical protein